MRFGCQLVPIWLPKMHQNQVLEVSWGLLEPSWRLLGPSWRHLEASWGHLGASWTYLGALKAILEASWRRFGPPKSMDAVNLGRGGGIAAATPEGYPEGLGY